MKLNLKNSVVALGAALTLGALSAQSAVAQISPPASQGFDGLLGDSTSGAETGIYEFMPMLQTAAGVIIAIVLVFVGVTIVKKVMRKIG